MKRAALPAVLTALCAVLSADLSLAQGTYYRWLDDRGNTVHSDRPPPAGTEYETISTTPSFSYTAEDEAQPDPAPAAENQQMAENAGEPRSSVPKLEEKIVKNPESCQRAQENMAALSTRARIRMRNADGEYYFLSEDDKALQIQRAQDTIDVHCE
ncbi:MAG: DUF4124 domain-containing protein [Pseudomonadota bacterium]